MKLEIEVEAKKSDDGSKIELVGAGRRRLAGRGGTRGGRRRQRLRPRRCRSAAPSDARLQPPRSAPAGLEAGRTPGRSLLHLTLPTARSRVKGSTHLYLHLRPPPLTAQVVELRAFAVRPCLHPPLSPPARPPTH